MNNRQYKEAKKEVEKLNNFLKARDWFVDFEKHQQWADKEIEEIRSIAIGNSIDDLEGGMLSELKSYAKGIDYSDGSKLSRRDTLKAQVTLRRIEKGIKKLKGVFE